MNKQLELLRALEEFDLILKDYEKPDYKKLGFKVEPQAIEFMEVAEAERNKLRKKIDANLISEYEKIKKRYGGRAVVQVIKGFCSGCYGKLPLEIAARCKREIKNCPNCGRFLYWVG